MPELNWMGVAPARRAAQRVPYRLLELGEGVGGAARPNRRGGVSSVIRKKQLIAYN